MTAVTDANGNKPDWHNSQWMIFDNAIEQIKPQSQSLAYWMDRRQIEQDPCRSFKHIVKKTWVDGPELYACFEQLESLWSIKPDYAEMKDYMIARRKTN